MSVETIFAGAALKRLQTTMPDPEEKVLLLRLDSPNVIGPTHLALNGVQTTLFKLYATFFCIQEFTPTFYRLTS
jgi:hypothetical protein